MTSYPKIEGEKRITQFTISDHSPMKGLTKQFYFEACHRKFFLSNGMTAPFLGFGMFCKTIMIKRLKILCLLETSVNLDGLL